jgi:putative transposase
LRRPVESAQYTSIDYTQTLADHRVLASVGSVGDAYHNALAESFVDSFKTELIADRVWRTRSQLDLAVVEYVGWYNADRLHESLGVSLRPSTSRSTSSADRLRSQDRWSDPTNSVPVEAGPAHSQVTSVSLRRTCE